MEKRIDHINEMESVFDKILWAQSRLERMVDEYKGLQADIQRLETYYNSQQWKEDFALDERGVIPSDIKRGVLSEDGLYNMLERNSEIMRMLETVEDEHDHALKKNPTYQEVVKKAQAVARIRGEYGNKDVTLYPCDTWLNGDQINLWSYWQGYQYTDIDEKGIDVLLVGQDWGNPDKDERTIARIEAMQSGKVGASYYDKASVTDENLRELFRCLGCDIEKTDPGMRLFFTNYSLGYRKGTEQGGMTKTLLRKDEALFDDLVKAIRPKIIICLGKITYEVVTGQVTRDFTEQLKNGKPFVAPYPNCRDIKVYGVAHCGVLGANNVGGIPSMKKAWKMIAKEFRK